jgi:hypothetical protein
MRMRNLERRVHLLLDEPRYRKVSSEARRRRVSVAAVIRDAIDQLPARADLRKRAIEQILAAESMPLPTEPAALRRELDDAHERPG